MIRLLPEMLVFADNPRTGCFGVLRDGRRVRLHQPTARLQHFCQPHSQHTKAVETWSRGTSVARLPEVAARRIQQADQTPPICR